MFRRRLSSLLKEHLPSEGLAESSKPSTGRRIIRGALLGGLAGGLIATAIEMTPEEYGLKQKVDKAISEGRKLFEGTKSIPDKPLVIAKPRVTPPVKETKKAEPEPPKEEIQAPSQVEVASNPSEELPTQVVEPEVESVVTEELAPVMEDEPVVEIPSSEIVQQKSETQEEQPLAEEAPPLVEAEVVADEPPVGPATAKIEFLEAETNRLKALSRFPINL